MKTLVTFLLLLSNFILIAQKENSIIDALVSPKIHGNNLSVGGAEADISGFNNQSIQFAIDAVAETGGTVRLNQGNYIIDSPIRMKSNVNLVGAGKQTILQKTAGVQTRFVVDADYGELKLTVENSDGFEIGMKVQITDKNKSSCWDVSTAYITDIQDLSLIHI